MACGQVPSRLQALFAVASSSGCRCTAGGMLLLWVPCTPTLPTLPRRVAVTRLLPVVRSEVRPHAWGLGGLGAVPQGHTQSQTTAVPSGAGIQSKVHALPSLERCT